jgi:hypothetical protein
MANFVKATNKSGRSVYVNLDLAISLTPWEGGVTRLHYCAISTSDNGTEYLYDDVKETPEDLLNAERIKI